MPLVLGHEELAVVLGIVIAVGARLEDDLSRLTVRALARRLSEARAGLFGAGPVLVENDLDNIPKKLSVIKKHSAYICVSTKNLRFLDILNFLAPGLLNNT